MKEPKIGYTFETEKEDKEYNITYLLFATWILSFAILSTIRGLND